MIATLITPAGGCAAPATEMVECPPEGCAALDPPDWYHKPLLEHAARDLQCDLSALTYHDLDDDSAEVSGCGKSARYASVLVDDDESRWVLDSPVTAAPGG